MDIIEENYNKAWERLDNIYLKPEECRRVIIDKIFDFQFSMATEKIEENFNNYCLMIGKLKTAYGIDLVNEEAGVDKALAHLTFKKFPQIMRNELLRLCSTHYPTFKELVKFIPIAIDRIHKSNSEGDVGYSCSL